MSVMYSGFPRGGARTLLFLHGFPEGSYTWWPVFSTGILDKYTLCAPDLRGYNKTFTYSSSGDPSLLVPQIALDVLELIKILGGEVDLVAHDWGGGIGWWLAAMQLPAIKTLTILNMAHPMGWEYGVRFVEGQQKASAYVLTFIQPGFSSYLTENNCSELKSWFSGEAWFTPSMEASLVSAWKIPGAVNAGLGWYRANIHPSCPLNCTTWQCFQAGISGTFDSMPNNGTVKIPTRVLWGMLDTAFDNDFQLAYMESKVQPHLLNITRYFSASHWIAQQIPGVVASAIAGFLD